MYELINRLDPARLLIAAKTCLALILGFAIALQLDWKASWMAILIVVLQADAVGMTFEKGALYIVGTLAGAATALVIIGLFAHDRELFILAMAMVTGYGLYRMPASRYAYAWLIFNVTLALVGWLPAQMPDAAFDLALERASTICVGVIVMLLVQGLLWPVTAGSKFEQKLKGFLEGSSHLLVLMRKIMDGKKPDPQIMKRSVIAQVQAIAALQSSLKAAVGDTPRFKQFHTGYVELIEQLKDLLLAVFILQDSVLKGHEQSARTNTDLYTAMESIKDQIDEIIENLDKPRTQMPQDDESPQPDSLVKKYADSIKNDHDAVIIHHLDELGKRITRVNKFICSIEHPEQVPAPAESSVKEPFSFQSTRLKKAFNGALVIMMMAWFFIITQWPMGLSLAMVFGTLAVCFGVMLPLILISRQLLISLLIGPAVAAPLYFVVMPHLDSYLQLIPWLCIAFLPLLYFQASPNPRTMVAAIFSSIFMIALLSLDEQNQSYSFSSFMTMWFGFAGGFGISLAVFRLFTTIVPEDVFWKQICAFFSESEKFIKDLGNNTQGSAAKEKIITDFLKQSQGTLKQLRISSKTIDYQHMPVDRHAEIAALIESIEYLALCLWSVANDHRQSTSSYHASMFDTLTTVYNSCVDSLQTISRSLMQQHPVPELSDNLSVIQKSGTDIDNFPESLPRDAVVPAISAISHARSLFQAIHECREKANVIDWQIWNRNYL